jgi:two-component system response regulator AtoC
MLQSSTLLLVSRRPSALTLVSAVGEANAWQVQTASSGWEALDRAQSESGPALVLLDLSEGDADALHTLRWLRRVRPELPVIMLAYAEDAAQRAEAIRLGAQDYLSWPLETALLQSAIAPHFSSASGYSDTDVSSENIEQVHDEMFFVSASPAMRHLRAQVQLLAQADAPLLIVGESGSGKEIVARLVHKLSVRSGFSFLKLNCAALPCDLLEAELFGQDRRVVAGSTRSVTGKLENSEKGTVFLNEITELPIALQTKLMQVMQEKHFFRSGGDSRVETDVRILAASAANLEQALADGKLREDLYYRLSAFSVYVPPVRQRKEDIPLLMGHFMNRLSRHYDLQSRSFSPAILEGCKAHLWPGNLRELENFVKRYLVVGDEELALRELQRKLEASSETLSETMEIVAASASAASSLPNGARSRGFSAEKNSNGNDKSSVHEEPSAESPYSGLRSLLQSVKGETEKNAIVSALEQTRWNRKSAARLLRVSYRTLLYKIQQYHLIPPSSYLPQIVPGSGVKTDGHGR